MKDIRLAGLPDGRVALFSRPHCGPGYRGRIGIAIVDGLDALSAEVIAGAPILHGQFTDSEWGGVNEVHLLRDGRLGLLGHIAWMEVGEIRHYYAMVFALDPHTGQTGPVRIIARRSQFPPGPAKRPDLVDVIFAGGLLSKLGRNRNPLCWFERYRSPVATDFRSICQYIDELLMI